jgi:hypothetical protein
MARSGSSPNHSRRHSDRAIPVADWLIEAVAESPIGHGYLDPHRKSALGIASGLLAALAADWRAAPSCAALIGYG